MNAAGESYGVQHLVLCFVAWKLLLLAVACASPGVGYDASTRILLDQSGPKAHSGLANAIEHIVLRLTRWDGIYFTSLAERGHFNEQEWAFSWVHAWLTRGAARVLCTIPVSPTNRYALSGILISHTSHLLSTLVLYRLTRTIFPFRALVGPRLAFIASALHIVSPAGIFLSAAYSESTFALFNFLGSLSYVWAARHRRSESGPWLIVEVFGTVLSGVAFGIAASLRSNGLLSGLIFLWDAVELLLEPHRLLRPRTNVIRLISIGYAGACVGFGFVLPQVVAYMEFCTNGRTRPWCESTLPSIYNWVQQHYWGVGPFRYWTLSNLPLFLISGPMLAVLLTTGFICLRRPDRIYNSLVQKAVPRKERSPDAEVLGQEGRTFARMVGRLALPQLVLAGTAIISFHVQIVNRISSGYPLWYIILAVGIVLYTEGGSGLPSKRSQTLNGRLNGKIVGKRRSDGSSNFKEPRLWYRRWVVKLSVMYAVVQAGLYASFLPPA